MTILINLDLPILQPSFTIFVWTFAGRHLNVTHCAMEALDLGYFII